jgi:hypothetical protein
MRQVTTTKLFSHPRYPCGAFRTMSACERRFALESKYYLFRGNKIRTSSEIVVELN